MTVYINIIGTDEFHKHFGNSAGNKLEEARTELDSRLGTLSVNDYTVSTNPQSLAVNPGSCDMIERLAVAYYSLRGGQRAPYYGLGDYWMVLDRCSELGSQNTKGVAFTGTAGMRADDIQRVGLVDYEANWPCDNAGGIHYVIAHELAHGFGACHEDGAITSSNQHTYMHTTAPESALCYDSGSANGCVAQFSYCAENIIEDRMRDINNGRGNLTRDNDCAY